MLIIVAIVSYALGIFETMAQIFLGGIFLVGPFILWGVKGKEKIAKDKDDDAAMIVWDKNGREIFRK